MNIRIKGQESLNACVLVINDKSRHSSTVIVGKIFPTELSGLFWLNALIVDKLRRQTDFQSKSSLYDEEVLM